ncbi:amidohydrolase family protein [candidate division WOR-3 bacterium]|nr:amidohydrolase family protein [candidate division WOR-3 bacterium]
MTNKIQNNTLKKEVNRYIVGNGVVTDGINLLLDNGAILINGENIEKIGKTEEIKEEGIDFIDVEGRLIIPGLVNFHHHLYSSLAVGLSPHGKTENFIHILENLWWRLDSALDEDSIYYSALLGIIDSIKYGVTTIFDHHASMNYVRNSLFTIESAFKLAGIKGVLCFETSDRMGKEEVQKHIDENLEFYGTHEDSSSIKGMFGLHANFTLSEKTLKKISLIKPEEIPIHIHCGEDKADLDFCINQRYRGVVDRLQRFGLLNSNSILAHAVHLSEEDYRILEDIMPIVVSNPESNANNRIGKMDRRRIKRFVLGTDGMSGDMIGTLRSLYLLGEGIQESLDEMKKIFFDYKYDILRKFFPETGIFEKGGKADIAVLNYIPITPLGLNNLTSHLIFGVKGGKVYMTISNGNILYKEGIITFLDENKLISNSTMVLKELYKSYYG